MSAQEFDNDFAAARINADDSVAAFNIDTAASKQYMLHGAAAEKCGN
jgi:hypothetical protein